MIRRTALIGLTVGSLGAAIGVVYVGRGRTAATPARPPAWPPLVVDDDPAETVAAELPPNPVVPDDDADVVVAPGPDTQPDREVPAPEPAAEPAAGVHPDGVHPDAVDPEAGTCPASHPIKGKLSSRIFHVPGLVNYERLKADRCYVDAAAARRDGLRVARR